MLCDTLIEKPLAFMGDLPKCPVPMPDTDEERAALRPEQIRIVRSWLQEAKSWQRAHSLIANEVPDGFDGIDDFAVKLKLAKKFFLSKDFADSTLQRLATPETVEKAKQFYALAHNPMWVEWRHGSLPKCNLDALLWQEEGDADAGITRGYYVHYMEKFDLSEVPTAVSFHKASFVADSLAIHDGEARMDVTGETGDESKLASSFSKLVTDFLIRINSPRITEFRPCQDMLALNKSRMKKGKQPLFSYLVVDLNNQVKESLRLSEEGPREGVRFHWRRGHFKARKDGLFWWNPHTAGRKELGEIVKDYAA